MNSRALVAVVSAIALVSSTGTVALRAQAPTPPQRPQQQAAPTPQQTSATAAPALDAPTLTTLVQAFYDQTTSFEADFAQQQFTRVYNRTQRARGRVVFKKPGLMRFDYATPNGQIFVSDGRTLRMYQPPEEGERNGQMVERNIDADQLPAAFGFLMGTGRLDQDFDARLLDARAEGFPNGHVLELRPKRPSPHFEKLVCFVTVIEQNGRRAGVIQRLLILDAAGNRNRFDFTRPQFNREVPASRFQYTPPRGTRTVRP